MKGNGAKYIAFGTLLLLVIVMAAATFVEKLYGSNVARQDIYGSWWFVALWAIMGVASLVYIFRQKLYRKGSAFALHLSFAVILLGALLTFLTADRGYLHIRQGQILNYYISDSDDLRRSLPFDLKLLLFDIEYHPDSDDPADFKSFIMIDKEVSQISMNKILKRDNFRLYQHSYDDDEMGSTFLVNYDPWGTPVTYLGYLLLALSIFWLLWLRIGWRGLLYIGIPTAIVWFYISQMNPMTPVLRSPMLGAHVSVIMVAYTLFLIMMILGVIALINKSKREKLYRLSLWMLYPASFLLALGIFIGAVWANISWGRYWGWDAKETWALITLLVYILPFHQKSFPAFKKPLFYHRYIVWAFLTVLMTFLGVSFLLGGIHSYV